MKTLNWDTVCSKTGFATPLQSGRRSVITTNFFLSRRPAEELGANAAAAELFFRKKAGQQILREIQKKHSRAGYALARGFAALVARVIAPVRRLLDSSVPLPGTRLQAALLGCYPATGAAECW